MRLQHFVEDCAMAAQDADGALLVLAHHPAIAEDIGDQDRREPALDRGLRIGRDRRVAGHAVDRGPRSLLRARQR
jgi:hypothetical protein